MLRTRESEAGAGCRPARPKGLAEARAGFGAALIFATLCGSSAYTLRPRAVEPVARNRAAFRLDPNAASRSELELLPGIGPNLSRRIIEYREHCARRPALRTAEDLDAVRGIGPAAVARLRDYLQFPPQAQLESPR
jgi:competence ComEA-like helix-hairpin-helix protein